MHTLPSPDRPVRDSARTAQKNFLLIYLSRVALAGSPCTDFHILMPAPSRSFAPTPDSTPTPLVDPINVLAPEIKNVLTEKKETCSFRPSGERKKEAAAACRGRPAPPGAAAWRDPFLP